MSVLKSRSKKKKSKEEVKQNFLDYISRIDRKEIEKVLHSNAKVWKGMEIFHKVTEQELEEFRRTRDQRKFV